MVTNKISPSKKSPIILLISFLHLSLEIALLLFLCQFSIEKPTLDSYTRQVGKFTAYHHSPSKVDPARTI